MEREGERVGGNKEREGERRRERVGGSEGEREEVCWRVVVWVGVI